MKDFIHSLPMDIVLQIIPYTYNLQNKELLNDIVNYKKTRSLLSKLYYNFWITYEEEYKNWLINDIFEYANNNIANMYGYVDKFYNIFRRNIFLQTVELIDNYVNNLEKKEVGTQINIFLGLLTISERNELVINFTNKIN